MRRERLQTDILIIGGGTAGCYAAVTLGQRTDVRVLIAEKANIKRSGCLAAGVNALNAYITKGHTPQFYTDYAIQDAEEIAREDLLLSMSENLNEVTADLERRGLVIRKDENGEYVTRGPRNIRINGENIKPLLAMAAGSQSNVRVLNHVNITDLKLDFDGKTKRVRGAYGFHVDEEVMYEIDAGAVLIATGGAAGLYRPNNPGFSRHKMWYPPFNTGAGYAMGILAGAEMTTFEMRFVALRCKDTIAPVGTIAQGVGARQVNSRGENYEKRYGLKTAERVCGTVKENREGRGPCFLRTKGISKQQEEDLYQAYLNMAPGQFLRWMEAGRGPSEENVEIEGTEPYVVGGHTASGYWVDTKRASTIPGLFAAGDAAGGCPQKYVTGALAEGKIAAQSMLEYLDRSFAAQREPAHPDGSQSAKACLRGETGDAKKPDRDSDAEKRDSDSDVKKRDSDADRVQREYEQYLSHPQGCLDAEQIEEAMQKTMDIYAGGISTDYRFQEKGLLIADRKIRELQELLSALAAKDMDELLRIYELRDRLIVCRTLLAHLYARKETRWRGFAENLDHPQRSAEWDRYVNSRMENGKIRILYRDLVRGGVYEHTD